MDESLFDRRLEQQLCFVLYRASNSLGKMYTRALRQFGLTFSQYLVLLALWDKEGVPMSDIGSRTGMGIGTLNPILTRMGEHGWIQRIPAETDRRTILIRLNEKAKASKQAINQSILRELEGCSFEGMKPLELMKQLHLLQIQLDALESRK